MQSLAFLWFQLQMTQRYLHEKLFHQMILPKIARSRKKLSRSKNSFFSLSGPVST